MSRDDSGNVVKSVVITDLDNTFYDWVGAWVASFSAMLEVLVRKSGVERDQLIAEIKAVHQKYGTSEYAFLIEELPSLKDLHPGENLTSIYDDAIYAYRKARKKTLALYRDVGETLSILKDRGCLIVGYTESMVFYTNYRVRTLELDGVLDFLYSPEDHDLPANLTREQVRMYPAKHYDLNHTVHRYTPRGELKPNPDVLLSIIDDIRIQKEDAVYVGDSLMKDVAMAQAAGVVDIHAKYGVSHHKEEYDLLRAVTHWTQKDVEREKKLSEQHVTPTYVLNSSYGELVEHFEFSPHDGGKL